MRTLILRTLVADVTRRRFHLHEFRLHTGSSDSPTLAVVPGMIAFSATIETGRVANQQA